ncbi:MAG: heavy-metal-associated domain-containing protein, partial [Fidelibacterota bacterium]
WQQSGEIRIYEVFGMDCPGCHEGVEKQILQIDGIKGAKADWTKKQVTVWVSADINITDESIHHAIRRANFTPGGRLK